MQVIARNWTQGELELVMMIQDTLHIRVEYFDGQDDNGLPYYVASCEEIVAVTEMVAASLEAVKVYNLTANPRIVVSYS